MRASLGVGDLNSFRIQDRTTDRAERPESQNDSESIGVSNNCG